MEKAFEFLKTNKEVAFATAEDGKPKIRVFQIMRQEKNILYFVTAPGKEVYRQLQKNPNIEVREIYAANPVLPRLYRAYTDLAYFRLPAVSLDYYDLTPDPPLQEHYDYEQK